MATLQEPKKESKSAAGVLVSEDHLHWLLVTSFRYSFGRSSYASLACLDLLQSYRTKLPANTKTILQQELQEHLQSTTPVTDRTTWQQCLQIVLEEKLSGTGHDLFL
jgi:hypothetical protein